MSFINWDVTPTKEDNRQGMSQKYINSDLPDGNVSINNRYLANFIDMIRVVPTTARTLLLLASYANKNGTVYADINSVTNLLGIKEVNEVIYAINYLVNNGWITLETIKLDNVHTIEDSKLADDLSNDELNDLVCYVNDEVVLDYYHSNMMNKITINTSMISVTGNKNNNTIYPKHSDVFYDKREDTKVSWGWR